MKTTEKEKFVIKFQPWVEYEEDGTGRYAEGTLVKVNEEVISFSFSEFDIPDIKKLLKACGVDNFKIVKV